MAGELLNAVKQVQPHFPSQIQGTCGLYTFYYCAHMVQVIDMRAKRKIRAIDPPRKRLHPVTWKEWGSKVGLNPFKAVAGANNYSGSPLSKRDLHDARTSLRKLSKVALDSAQGEVLTGEEMVLIIEHYGYKAHVSTATDATAKAAFIKAQLNKNRPVIIPYINGANRAGPVIERDKPAAHWSVIFALEGDKYRFIDPNRATSSHLCPVARFLQSNANVDDKLYARYWEKTANRPAARQTMGRKDTKSGISALETAADKPKPALKSGAKVYDIYQEGREQDLKNFIVAIS